jgi:hypothetical protein
LATAVAAVAITATGVGVGVAATGVGVAATGDPGPRSSVVIQEGLCETTGGGEFVAIPGFPGEMIDVRLLKDVEWMVQRYKIFITDGYATSGHAPNGEHPIGLALDIVPNKAAGGSWKKVTRLARWAEPTQNSPRAPFRWVGYNGDSGHGRGHHLHLSWMHSKTKPKVPAEVVYTRFCPGGGGSPSQPPSQPSGQQKPPQQPQAPLPARERQEILDNLPFAGPNYAERMAHHHPGE